MTAARRNPVGPLAAILGIAVVALLVVPAGAVGTGPPNTAGASGTWTNLTAFLPHAPPADWGWAAAFDGSAGRILLFGGCPVAVLAPCLSQTWTFTAGAGWLEVNAGTRNAPSARQGAAMAYDPRLGGVVLFGGGSPYGIDRDTWLWHHGHWTDLTSTLARAPPARYDARMVWDGALDAIVLFGGSGCRIFCGDTWEFGTKWTKVTSAVSPSPRAWPGLAYDRADGYLLLTGGQGRHGPGAYRPLRDTWMFNGTRWVELHPSVAPPAADQPTVAYDGATRTVVYVGDDTGSTWTFHAGTWTNVTASSGPGPSARGLPGLAMDPRTGYLVLFGGGGSSGALDDTWTWG